MGSVVTYEPEGGGEPLFLLCRRAIPPRKGYLNLPAGYMERGESLAEAATREAREEATAQIEVGLVFWVWGMGGLVGTCGFGVMGRKDGDASGFSRSPTDKRHTCMYVMQCGPILAVYDIPHIAQVHVYHIARLLNPDSVRPGYESLDAQLLPWYGMQCLVRSFVVLPLNAVQASAAPICVTQNHRTHFTIGPPSTSTASPFPPSRGR